MNKVILMGRLTRDPETRNNNDTAVTRYTLAVDRRFNRGEQKTADFINCVTFGKSADFAAKYFRQGTKIVVSGRIQTGSYTKSDGTKVYTTDVVVEDQEFAESKKAQDTEPPRIPEPERTPEPQNPEEDFMSLPDGLGDENLPFH